MTHGQEAWFPVYSYPEEAVRAMRHLVRVRQLRDDDGPVRVLAVKTEKLQDLSPESQASFYKAFLTITMERLIEKNAQVVKVE